MSSIAVSVHDELAYAKNLLETIVDRFPKRRPASEDERRAQELMREEFVRLGIKTSEHDFEFNDNLYANIALHFGLGALGTVVSGLAPALGLTLHGLAAGSYWAESTRRAYILRRLLGFKPSRNLLAVVPAEGEMKLRLVIPAHIDAAFTGFLFSSFMVKAGSKSKVPFLRRSMAFATQATAALTFFDALRCVFGPLTWPLRPLEYALTIPAFLAFALNVEMVVRNEIVPGANDNLSAVAALPILARRLMDRKLKNVELVFAVTGCEEASLGGADALARDMEGVWEKDKTVILGLDSLSNGDLFYLEIEGEVVRTPIPAWLKETVEGAARTEERFAREVKGFEVPVGGSDVAAFLARGWDGVCLTCIDPERGSARHYHQSSDTPENLDWDKIGYCIDFTEKLALGIIDRKLGRG